jgi:hypothetical protein
LSADQGPESANAVQNTGKKLRMAPAKSTDITVLDTSLRHTPREDRINLATVVDETWTDIRLATRLPAILGPDPSEISPCPSIVHLRQKTRNDLHLFLAILVLLAFNLGSLCATLLLRLARFHPLLHGQVLTKLGQIVVLQPEAVEKRAVGDGV